MATSISLKARELADKERKTSGELDVLGEEAKLKRIQQFTEPAKAIGSFMGGFSKLATSGKGGSTARKDNKGNDISWSDPGDGLLEAVASLAFPWVTGTLAPNAIIKRQGDNVSTDTAIIPGVMQFEVFPTMGVGAKRSGSTISGTIPGIELAAKKVFAKVRSVNSGAQNNYGPATIMMTNTVYLDLLVLVTEVERAYHAWKWGSYYNKAGYAQLISACGISFSDIQQNYKGYEAFLIRARSQLEDIAQPIFNTTAVNRIYYAANIFKETDAPNAQLYVFRNAYYRWYDDENDCLKFTSLPGGANLTTIRSVFDKLLQSLLSSQIESIILGDLIKAYGTDSILKLAPFNPEGDIQLIYSEEVLNEIDNMSVVAPHDSQMEQFFGAAVPLWTVSTNGTATAINEGCTVGDATGYFFIAAATSGTYASAAKFTAIDQLRDILSDNIIHIPFDHPTPGDVVTATKFKVGNMVTGNKPSEGLVAYAIDNYRDMVVIGVYYYDDPLSGAASGLGYDYAIGDEYSGVVMAWDSATPAHTANYVLRCLHDRWHKVVNSFHHLPKLYTAMIADFGNAQFEFLEMYHFAGQFENVRELSNEVLGQIQQTCNYGLFMPRISEKVESKASHSYKPASSHKR